MGLYRPAAHEIERVASLNATAAYTPLGGGTPVSLQLNTTMAYTELPDSTTIAARVDLTPTWDGSFAPVVLQFNGQGGIGGTAESWGVPWVSGFASVASGESSVRLDVTEGASGQTGPPVAMSLSLTPTKVDWLEAAAASMLMARLEATLSGAAQVPS